MIAKPLPPVTIDGKPWEVCMTAFSAHRKATTSDLAAILAAMPDANTRATESAQKLSAALERAERAEAELAKERNAHEQTILKWGAEQDANKLLRDCVHAREKEVLAACEEADELVAELAAEKEARLRAEGLARDILCEFENTGKNPDYTARARALLKGEPESPPEIKWQCSGCRWGFPSPWLKTCPACGKNDYWSGSVHPSAVLWDGKSKGRVPEEKPSDAGGREP